MRSLPEFLRSVFSRSRFEQDMREELALHIEHRADDLVAGGRSRDDALRQARLEFGAVEACKERCRDAHGFRAGRIVHGLRGDFRLATRRLTATPLFTAFAVLSLAVGVGVTTAVYSVVDAVLWKELGIDDPDTVVLVTAPQSGRQSVRSVVSRPDYDDLRAAQTSFSTIAAAQAIFPAVALPATTELVPAEAVDGSYFATLGVRATIGRVIQPSDESPPLPVVVLGDVLWRTRFRGDPAILGTSIRLSGRPFEVVGVAGRSFSGGIPGPTGPQLWVPLGAAEWVSRAVPSDRERPSLTVFGRLPPGATRTAAAAELSMFAAALDRTYPRVPAPEGRPRLRGWSAQTVAELNRQGDGMRRFGLIVIGLVALLLVVACTNLANLALARGTVRQSEFAVRRALGASRWRLVREQCAESLLLAAAGAVAAWFVLQALIVLLNVEVPFAQHWIVSLRPEVNATALVAAASALVLSLVVFGLEPAMQLTRTVDVRRELAASSGSVGAPRKGRQRALLRWQVAISAGFFIIASMCVRYLVAEARHDSGVDIDRMGVARVDFVTQRWDEPRARRALDRVMQHVGGNREIETAAVSTGLPFGTTITPLALLSTPDKPILPTGSYEDALLIAATPGFFRTTGIPMLRGRGFDDRDDAAANPVIVLSESAARRVFGTSDVVGRQLQVKDVFGRSGRTTAGPVPQLVTIVGVARDTDTTHMLMRGGNVVYRPFAQSFYPSVTVVARAQNPATAARVVRDAIRQADPDLAISVAGTGRMILAGPYVFLRGAGIVALSLGALTLFLAMVGLYGVQSQLVTCRTREIGVRMSCGATAEAIKRLVLKDGYAPVVQGLTIGLGIGIAGRSIIASLTPVPIGVIDPWMLALVPIPPILAGFCACYLPAHRASLVDPIVALRHL